MIMVQKDMQLLCGRNLVVVTGRLHHPQVPFVYIPCLV